MPTCECGISYVVVAKVWYSRHDLLGKHWAYMRSKGKIKPRKAKENGASPVLVAVVGALGNLGIKPAEARRQVQTALDADPALKDDEDALLLAAVKGGNDGNS